MLILVLLRMYFNAVGVFVTSQTLLFRLALAILCICTTYTIFFFAYILPIMLIFLFSSVAKSVVTFGDICRPPYYHVCSAYYFYNCVPTFYLTNHFCHIPSYTLTVYSHEWWLQTVDLFEIFKIVVYVGNNFLKKSFNDIFLWYHP